MVRRDFLFKVRYTIWSCFDEQARNTKRDHVRNAVDGLRGIADPGDSVSELLKREGMGPTRT